jgi:hypothetical protein
MMFSSQTPNPKLFPGVSGGSQCTPKIQLHLEQFRHGTQGAPVHRFYGNVPTPRSTRSSFSWQRTYPKVHQGIVFKATYLPQGAPGHRSHGNVIERPRNGNPSCFYGPEWVHTVVECRPCGGETTFSEFGRHLNLNPILMDVCCTVCTACLSCATSTLAGVLRNILP